MNYVPLHVHSEYSLLDGLSQTSQISKRLSNIETSACALTDHGSVSGAVDFCKALKGTSHKPILGCEFYLCENGAATMQLPDNKSLIHQVVLAKNFEGWKDILQLISQANNPNQFYYKPRIDFNQLQEVAQKGNLISFSGHLGSRLGNLSINNTADTLLCAEALKMQDMFGKGNFFIEIQLMDGENNPESAEAAHRLREISKQTKIPCVATPDAHYPTKEAAEDQRVLLCTALKKTIGQVHRELKEGKSRSLKSFFSSDNFHIPSHGEMSSFHTEEELANTSLIADMCEEYPILGPPSPPKFPCPKGFSTKEY